MSHVIQAIADRLDNQVLPDHAKRFQDSLVDILQDQGFDCLTEVPVDDRGDGRSGRLDILGVRDNVWLAIECDRREPREKSVRKLLSVEATVRAVVLRRHAPRSQRPDGIYVIGAAACAP